MNKDVEKIRAEIKRLQQKVINGATSGQYSPETIREKNQLLASLISFIDSMQEEPKTDWLQELQNKLDSLSKEDFEKVFDKYAVDFKEEPVSEELGDYINELSKQFPEVSFAKLSRIAVRVAKWQKENLWKPADGDDLPEIDREVIALLNDGKVVFAHRPYKGKYIGKNLTTGNIETFENETYDKGGWNIPNVKWWLDVKLPKEIEL